MNAGQSVNWSLAGLETRRGAEVCLDARVEAVRSHVERLHVESGVETAGLDGALLIRVKALQHVIYVQVLRRLHIGVRAPHEVVVGLPPRRHTRRLVVDADLGELPEFFFAARAQHRI